jgi:Cu(I)/Ag(I) efflux system membrane fusion protein
VLAVAAHASSKIMKRILLFSVFILAALGTGYWLAQRIHATPHSSDTIAAARQTYVCPMHSHIVQDHPGMCPICGMDLVRMSASPAAEANQIHVDTATQQRLGVRLASVEKTQLTQAIHTYATLVLDDGTLYRVTPTMDGVLVKLHASRPGQRLAAGAVLYEFYSEELLQHQNEYLDFLKRLSLHRKSEERMRAQNQKELESARKQEAAASKQTELDIRQREEQSATMLIPIQRDGERLTARLKYAGFTDAMLRTLAQTQHALSVVPVRAQRECVVKEVSARPGMTISAMTEIVSCVDTAHAWLEVALYPDQTPSVRAGDPFTARFDDGSEIAGHLSGLSPILDSGTRTLRARIPVSLTGGTPLGSYAEVTIQAAPREVLSVPAGAVLRTGHGDFVLRALGQGHFAPVKVQTGLETEDRIAIRDGLSKGDQVVVNGQFLLDAAASIADAAQRFNGGRQP